MRNSGVPGSRSWLISQMRHGVHVEESATVVTGRGDMPCALALLDTRLTGICKPHMETLQQFLSSGADMNCELDIKLTDIADIKVRKDFMAHRESIGGKACPEVVYIFHGREDRASCCTVYPSTTRFSKVLLSLWYSVTVRSALNVRLTTASHIADPMTQEYYKETVLSLKLAESRSDLIVVLSEFARECQEDMSLKLLAFETLDVFIVLQAVCRGALFQSDAATRDTFMRPDLLWTSCLDMVVDRGTEDARTLQLSREKAEAELLERFGLYKCALHVMANLLFGSDVVHLKQRLIAGPSPLTVTSWLPLVVCDVNAVLSEILGFEATAKGLEEVSAIALEDEILRSVQPGGSGRSTSQMGLGTDDFLRKEFLKTSFDDVRGSRIHQSVSMQSSRSSGTSFGLQRRVKRQLVFAHATSPALIEVRQTTLDLQGLILTFLGECSLFGTHSNTRPSNQVEFGGSFAVSNVVVDSVGECVARLPDWDSFLELLVVRCGVIIDDFMNADCVASELRQQHKERENLLRAQSVAKVAGKGGIRDRLRGSSEAASGAEAKQEGPKEISAVDLATGARIVSFEASVDVRQNAVSSSFDRTGFMPVPMSPKKARRSFVKGATAAKEESSRIWSRKGKQDRAMKPTSAPRDLCPSKISTAGPLLETQEVLIFYFTQLICFLSSDCTQIKKYFECDLKDYIIAIVCCLRYLCPLKGRYQSVVVASARAASSAAAAELAASAAAAEIAAAGKGSAVFKGNDNKATKDILLKAKAKSSEVGEMKSQGDSNSRDKKRQADRDLWLNETLELTTDSRSQKRMQSSLAEFEDARFGLTESAWRLMLLSSLQLEYTFSDIVDDVPLDVDTMFQGF